MEATFHKGWKNGEQGQVIVGHLAKLSSAGTWMIENVPEELVDLFKDIFGQNAKSVN